MSNMLKCQFKNPPLPKQGRNSHISEDDATKSQKYCIIPGAATQAELLFPLAVIFVPFSIYTVQKKG